MLFVLSMHRSGSSLLAGLLNRYGLNVGPVDALVKKREANQLGFWERQDVVKLNKSILHKDGHGTMVPDLDKHYELTEDEADQIAGLAAKFETERVNVLKDPRLCVTLPVWQSAISTVKVIHLVRNPMEVARSLEKRQQFPIPASLALWEYYNICALRNTVDTEVYYLHFDELIQSPDQVARKIIDWSGEQVIESDEQASFAYREELVHHKLETNDVSGLSQSQLKLYESLSSGSPDLPPSHSQSMIATFAMLDVFIERGFSPVNGKCRDPEDVTRIMTLEARAALAETRARAFERITRRLLQSRAGRLLDSYYQTKDRFRSGSIDRNITLELKQLLKPDGSEGG